MVMGESQERQSVPESCRSGESIKKPAVHGHGTKGGRIEVQGEKHSHQVISTSRNTRLLKGKAFKTLQVADI